jgi:hypothetical protein
MAAWKANPSQSTVPKGEKSSLIREQKVAQRAIAYVKMQAARYHIKVHTAKLGSGYDLVFLCPSGKKIRIEVKGSEKDNMIPDMRVSEFDEARRLKADFLYFIGNVFKRAPMVHIIPRKAIRPEDLSPRGTYHLKFGKNRLQKYRKDRFAPDRC